MKTRLTTCVHILALLLATGLAYAEDAVIWQEAESFAETGRWANDSQHVDIMGSPYLLATGVGDPVADATSTVQVNAPGTYRLWVRCRDWYPTHSPGQFQVSVGEKPSATVFGKADNDDWQWVDGGEFELAAGDTELRLKDLTGWWGRCDALVLAQGDFQPSNDLKTLAQQRLQFAGVSPDVQEQSDFDVVVTGAGSAGLGAAIAAARGGSRVAFIQDRPVLGGNASDEIQVPPMGHIGSPPDKVNVTGIAEELYPTQGWANFGSSNHYAKLVSREENISLFLNTRAVGVEMEDPQTIAAVLALNVKTGQRLRFSAPLFIDTTGHGWIGYFAGADYRHGTEARSEYNESMAPLKANQHTMGNSLYKTVFKNMPAPAPFVTPKWAYQWSSRDDFVAPLKRSGSPVRHESFDKATRGPGRPVSRPAGGYTWFMEIGGMQNTITDAEKIRDELFRMHIGIWGYQKNTQQVEKLKNQKLIWLNYVPGVRESRRLMGDYIMTQKDFDEQIVHTDTVAFTDWGIDDHHPHGYFTKGMDVLHVYHGRRVSIPYRSLYSKNISNLFMAGRCMSASHLALGGVRVQRPMAATGQAVGTAAAMATREQCLPRDIYTKHISELQQELLKAGCYLIGVKNKDPKDLARTARTRTGSIIDGWNREITNVSKAVPWRSEPLELSFSKPQTITSVHLSLSNRHNQALFAIEGEVTGSSARDPWQELARTHGANKQRRHVVNFRPTRVNRIRLRLLRSSAPIAVTEVRVYSEASIPTDDSATETSVAVNATSNGSPKSSRKAQHSVPEKDLPGIIVDDTKAEFSGDWTTSTWGLPAIGLDYQHDGDARNGKARAIWKVPLPKPGHYEVRLGYSAYTNRATNVPVTITHAKGKQTVLVNQRVKPTISGRFVSLGKFDFTDKAIIQISNEETDGYVMADALQIIDAN